MRNNSTKPFPGLADPPHDSDAERKLLASILIDPGTLPRVNLTPAEFFDEAHAQVFGAIQAVAASGATPDHTLIVNRLKQLPAEQAACIGKRPAAMLIDIAKAEATAANVVYYADIVRDKATARDKQSEALTTLAAIQRGETIQQPAVKRALELPAYRPFPVDDLPDAIRGYTTAAARAIGCDPAFVALPLLAALASAIGNTRRIKLKRTWCEPCVLWTAIVGDSGTHKTPALSAATAILGRRQDEAIAGFESKMEHHERDLLAYEADLAEWKRVKPGTRGEPPDRPDEPICPRYIVSDTTVEALADRLQYAPRGLLKVRDELAGWFGSFNQYKGGKGGDEAHWLTLYNAQPLRIDRKTGAKKLTYVPIASVGIAGGIQPDTLRRALGREHFENGLAARLLLAFPPKQPRRWSEATVSEAVEGELARIFDGLLLLDFALDEDRRPRPIDLPLTPEAREVWIDFYNRHGGEQAELSGNEAALWSKLEGTAPRLALILQLVSDANSMAVDEVSMAAGITLANWFGKEGRRVYGVLGESEEERRHRQLVEQIQQRGGSVTPRDLMRSSRRYSDASSATAALSELVNVGFGRWEQTTTTEHGGRPAMRFRLTDSVDVDGTPIKAGQDRCCVNVSAVETDTDQF